MQHYEPLENDKHYHIYNCGINGEDLFRENKDHEHFLRLYDKYIDPVAETFAWCLPCQIILNFNIKQLYYFYVLRNLKDGRNHTGYAKNLKLRFEQLCSGVVELTNKEQIKKMER